MNSKLIKASVAGAAVIALAAGGSTYSAWSDFGNVNGNSVGAGFLKLDLGPAGTGQTPLDYGQLDPGTLTTRAIWVVSNDGASVPNANLAITFKNLTDAENGCSSASESVDDPTCGNANDTGELSKVVDVGAVYYPQFTTAAECAAQAPSYPQPYNSILNAYEGNLPQSTDTPYTLKDGSNNPLVLAPGDGTCIAFNVYWPKTGNNNPTNTTDNAAQGDSMKFDVRFDLTQA